MRRVLGLVRLTALLTIIAALACSSPSGVSKTEPVVTLHTVQGKLYLRFFPELAPEHVVNFLAHCESGLYEGCTFHRVIPGFVIQGGDPNSKDDDPLNDGMGGYSYLGPGTTLDAEFNDMPHRRGILSMARAADPNSAGSQFFIVQEDALFLDGRYTVFGEVIDGLDTVDRLVNVQRDNGDRPIVNQTIEQVLIEDWPIPQIKRTRKQCYQDD